MEAEEELVEAEVVDVCVRRESIAHGSEVDWAMVLVNLNRVAAAEGDVRAAFAGEVGEEALSADGAGGVGFGGVDLSALVGPEVVGEEGAAHEVGLVGEEFESLGGLDGGGEVDRGGEDAGGVAGFYGAGGRLGEDAGEAGGGGVFQRVFYGYVAPLRS